MGELELGAPRGFATESGDALVCWLGLRLRGWGIGGDGGMLLRVEFIRVNLSGVKIAETDAGRGAAPLGLGTLSCRNPWRCHGLAG